MSLTGPSKYPYDLRFQEGVLALMAQQVGFLRQHEDVLRAEYFDSDSHATVARLILRHGFHYNGDTPTRNALETEFVDYCAKYKATDVFREGVLRVVEIVYTTDLSKLTHIPDKIISFGRSQAMVEALVQCVEQTQKGEDPENCRPIMEKAFQVGMGRDLGITLEDGVSNLHQLISSSSMNSARKIPTLLPTLDKVMRGGLGVGELGMVIGPTGKGKSIVLVNLAAAAVLSAKKVVYVTFELFEVEVLLRFLARLSGGTFDEIIGGNKAVEDRLKRFAANTRRYLRIKYYPPSSLTVGGLRAYLSRIRAVDGWFPDLLLLDDADSMRMPKGYDSDTSYYGLGALYSQIIQVLVDTECACWAASQATRGAYDTEVVSLEHVAESFKKAHRANAALSLCQTPEERKKNQCRIFIAKGRGFEDNRTILCDLDKQRMLLSECVNQPVPSAPVEMGGGRGRKKKPVEVPDVNDTSNIAASIRAAQAGRAE